jgi:hypothetical protein
LRERSTVKHSALDGSMRLQRPMAGRRAVAVPAAGAAVPPLTWSALGRALWPSVVLHGLWDFLFFLDASLSTVLLAPCRCVTNRRARACHFIRQWRLSKWVCVVRCA